MSEVDAKILVAAASVLAEQGWHAFTLERVADAAGVNRTTLYRRGITVDGLVDGLAVQAAQAYQAALWPALTDRGDGAARLRMALEAICAVSEVHLQVLAALDAAPDPIFHLDAPPRSQPRQVFTDPLVRIITDGIADGSLVDEGPEETAELLLNMVARTYIHLRDAHGWEPGRAVSRLVGMAMADLTATQAG